MTMIRFVGLALVLAGPAGAAQAQEKWKLYDNFNSTAIDQARWPGVLDRAREVSGRQLRVMARDYAATNTNTGFNGVSQNQSLPHPEQITQIRATVTPTQFDVVGCTGNPQIAQARARIYGTFFNTGAGTFGSMEGDIEAQMRLQRSSHLADPPGVMRVDAVVRRCDDAACNAVTELAAADFGTVTLGTPVALQMHWESANQRFVFSRDGGAPVALNYTVPNAGPAHVPASSIGIRNTVPNCTTLPRPTSMIDARFDDLSINKSALP